jgi:type VII secretion protein EccE
LVLVQVAVVAVLLAVGSRRPLLIIGVVALALLGLVPLLLRVRGQWYTDVVAARRRLRRRRRHVQVLAPGFEVTAYESDGLTIGAGADDDGWFVAAEVLPPAGRATTVPLDRLAALLVDGSVPVSAVQVVTWLVPAPHHLLPPHAACAESYRQLFAAGQVGPAATTGRTWVALRLDDADAVERTDGTDDTARRVLAGALRRLGRVLTTAGAGHDVLDPGRLTAAVATCVGLDRGADQPVEGWSSWAAGGLAHAAFEVVRWPATAVTAETLRELCQVPAAQVVQSIELRRDGAQGAVVVRAVVRPGAAPPRLADAAGQLTVRAEQAGLRLRRLDGEQAPAGYFCAPTGGSRW